MIVINISEYDRLEPSISVNRNHIKIVDINLFTFLKTVSIKKMEGHNIINNLEELNFNNSQKDFKFNPNLLNKFSFLNKLNLMYLLENEDPNSIDKNYNLIFIFHNNL